MSAIRLFSLGLCVVTGCTFQGATGEGGQGGPDYPADPSIDAPGSDPTDPTPFVSQCEADTDLRLCLEFENPEAFVDHSTHRQTITPTNVDLMPRTPGQAAKTDFGAKLVVGESPSLDVDRVTISMWIQPRQLGTTQYLFDNQGQYSLQLQADGTIRCDMGSDWLNSDTEMDQPIIPATQWVHVACTFDRNEIAVFVNGTLEDCTSSDVSLAKSPKLGSAVGGNLEVGGTVTNPFMGGLDFVKVYARALSHNEICSAANRTNCPDRCDRSGGQGRPGGGD